MGEPFLEVHPTRRGGHRPDTSLARPCLFPQGSAILRVLVTDRVQQGSVFAPIHWTSEYTGNGRISSLVNNQTDAISGQPDSKAAQRSHIEPLNPAWYGFAISAQSIDPDTTYWAKARHSGGWRTELADNTIPDDWEAYARSLFAASDAEVSSVIDPNKGTARVAVHQDGQLVGALIRVANPGLRGAQLGFRPIG